MTFKLSKFSSFIVNMPLGYWLVSRMNLRLFGGWVVREYLFWLLSVAVLTPIPFWEAVCVVSTSWVALMLVYEIGYWHNDLVSEKEKTFGTERSAKNAVRPLWFLSVRLIGSLCIILWKLFSGDRLLAVLIVVTITSAFAHNTITPRYRLMTFVFLKLLLATVPVSYPILEFGSRDSFLLYILIAFLFDICPRGFHYGMIKTLDVQGEHAAPLLRIWPFAMTLPCILTAILLESIPFAVLSLYRIAVGVVVLAILTVTKSAESV